MKYFQVDPQVGNDEYEILKDCFDKRWLTEGPKTALLLSKLQEITSAEFVFPVPNGTLALYVALLALNPEPGDEIIIPSFTFYASASAAVFAGFKPVFCDVDPITFTIDPVSIEKKISKKTKAVMPVNIYGRAVTLNRVIDLCRRKGLKIIEDSAQAVGVYINNAHSGTLGDVGTLSFFADKTVTMGEGGAIITNDHELASRIKLLRNQGRENSGTFIHPSLGMNFRITDLQAAVGVAQLQKLPDIRSRKQKLFKLYHDHLSNIRDIILPTLNTIDNDVPFRFYLQSEESNELSKYLADRGVQTRSFFYPMHLQPVFTKMYPEQDSLPVSEYLFRTGLCLPLHTSLSDTDVSDICNHVKSYFS